MYLKRRNKLLCKSFINKFLFFIKFKYILCCTIFLFLKTVENLHFVGRFFGGGGGALSKLTPFRKSEVILRSFVVRTENFIIIVMD